MPSSLIVNKEFKNASMANVFHSDNNVRVYAVGFVNPSCNESVTYDIYLLNKNYKSPVDGKKISSVTQKYPYAGYHRVYLDDPVYIPKGADYSVVATVTEENGSNCVTFKAGTNRAYAEMLAQQQKQAYIAAHGSDEDFEPTKITYNKGVVNKGESFVTVFFEQDSIKRELELFDRSSITTATAKVAATNDSSKPVDSSTPTNSDTDSASASSDNGNETIKNPDTGAKHNTAATLVIIGFVVLIAAASVITSKKDKDS